MKKKKLPGINFKLRKGLFQSLAMINMVNGAFLSFVRAETVVILAVFALSLFCYANYVALGRLEEIYNDESETDKK